VVESLGAEEAIRRNVDAIKAAYAEVGKGDFGGIDELVHPDVVVRDRPESPDPRTYRGLDGMREALASSDESFDDFRLEPEDFVGEGDYVIVVLMMRGTGRGSGITVEERIAHQWRLRDGVAVEMQVYSDPDDAVRDARAAS
jgi:ketosteroid isomerase-like protein